jgi:phosphoribosyl-ATP pyrophosphohydrolase
MFKTLKDLIVQIKKNKKKNPKISYTATLIKGKNNISLKKFLEEAKELFKASHYKNKKQIKHEAADLLYHFLVLLEFKKVSFSSILGELKKRRKISGIQEKKNRKKNVR